MADSQTPAEHPITRPSRSPNRILLILFALLISLAVFFLIVLLIAGSSTLLQSAEVVKPYAIVYQPLDISAPPGSSLSESETDDLIIFLGDSSVAQPPWAPKDSPGIPTLLQAALDTADSAAGAELSGARVVDWSFDGGRPFHYYCLLFEAERVGASLVIIPINWRSLGPMAERWNRTYAFQELSAMVPLDDRAYPPGRTIMSLEGISKPRQALYAFHRLRLYLTGAKVWIKAALTPRPKTSIRILSPKKSTLARRLTDQYSDEKFFTQYACDIPADSMQLRQIRALVETASRRRIKILFYITPIHIDDMRRRAPFDAALFAASTANVIASTASDVTACVDLKGMLPENAFLDNFEHYSVAGNRAIAKALAPAVIEMLNRPIPSAPETR